MNKCGIVKDLLPLYADDVCSIESKKFVTEHLAECEECCKELESYQLDVITGNAAEKEAVKKFKKKTERKQSSLLNILFVHKSFSCVLELTLDFLFPTFSRSQLLPTIV